MLDAANSLMEKAKSKGVRVLLPEDVVIANMFAADANSAFEKFAASIVAIAEKLVELSNKKVMTIVRGGDTVAAVKKVGFASIMRHVSTGDGSSLELLEGKALPGILALDDV
ncbi:phosphoglycerate kinase, cytosolic-like [Rosa chinensis]|uniref:phosphoglycerate kinase, cytosolic-like n=1 Tax=Rosa chinensis TaxID=74649 RepID=UPI000D0938EE|nr:phosphoglycerate kinase, cytosolic-like [Rosa chinensis]